MSCDPSLDGYRPVFPRAKIIAVPKPEPVISARLADALLAFVGALACALAGLLSTTGFFSP